MDDRDANEEVNRIENERKLSDKTFCLSDLDYDVPGGKYMEVWTQKKHEDSANMKFQKSLAMREGLDKLSLYRF